VPVPLVGGPALSGSAANPLRNRFAFCLPEREQALGYPVDGGPGSGAATIVSCTAPPIRRRICRACLPAPTAVNIPALFHPTRLHPDVLARMRADASTLLAPYPRPRQAGSARRHTGSPQSNTNAAREYDLIDRKQSSRERTGGIPTGVAAEKSFGSG
jgi:hypothetical protein